MIQKLKSSHGLVAEILRCVQSWLRVDKVRVSPREGEIWRLEPGAVVLVDGRTARVVARAIGENVDGPFVAYQCETAVGLAELIAQPTGEWMDFDRSAWNTPTLTWREAGSRRTLEPSVVEVVCSCSIGRRDIR